MEEIWKAVPGYEGIYEVSCRGRVKRVKSGRIRKTVISSNGYSQVTLSRDNQTYTFLNHQLVMRAHVGPCPVGLEVCHNDGDRMNACLSNLRYGTHHDNLLDRRIHGTASTNAGEANAKSKMTLKDIEAIRAYPRYKGSREVLAQRYGLNKGYISCIRTGKAWKNSNLD